MVGRKGLFEHTGYAQARGSLPRLCVESARNQDSRHPNPLSLQTVNDVEAVHTGRVLVDYQTAGGATAIIGKEIGPRTI